MTPDINEFLPSLSSAKNKLAFESMLPSVNFVGKRLNPIVLVSLACQKGIK